VDSVGYDVNQPGFSVSSNGRIAYRSGGAGRRQLTWFDRMGKALGSAGEPDADNMLAPELSPDERRVSMDRTVQGNRDIWLMELIRGAQTRFTFDGAVDGIPLWSPDGSRIAFESNRKGTFDIWIKPSSMAGTEELLVGTTNNEWPDDWSKDGRFLLYYQNGPETGSDLWAIPLSTNEADRKPFAVVNTPFEETYGQFSPDGRWVAYQTNESNRFEILVQGFPVPAGKWQVSTNGGIHPRWRADGKELYFIAPDSKLMAVPVAPRGNTFEAGTPTALFQTRLQGVGFNSYRSQYAVSRDGRFLLARPVEETSTTPITLILNWSAERGR
jgi:Tol biopolymer transport system component